MTIFDLIFVITCICGVSILGGAVYAVARGRWKAATRAMAAMCLLVGLYAAVLIGVSLTSTQRVLGLHQPDCFDEWCLDVVSVTQWQSVGVAPMKVAAEGHFYLVTVQVSNQGRRTSQRAVDAQVYLVDASGQRYPAAGAAQRILDAAGEGGAPLDTIVPPAGAFTRTVVFDLPLVTQPRSLIVIHGLFPTILIIGHPQSFLHQPTVLALPAVQHD